MAEWAGACREQCPCRPEVRELHVVRRGLHPSAEREADRRDRERRRLRAAQFLATDLPRRVVPWSWGPCRVLEPHDLSRGDRSGEVGQADQRSGERARPDAWSQARPDACTDPRADTWTQAGRRAGDGRVRSHGHAWSWQCGCRWCVDRIGRGVELLGRQRCGSNPGCGCAQPRGVSHGCPAGGDRPHDSMSRCKAPRVAAVRTPR